MVWAIGIHGPNDADVIDSFSQVRKNIAHLNSALAILLKTERRLHQIAGTTFCLRIPSRRWFAVILVEHWLWIKGVNVRRPAGQEQVNDMLCLRREMRSWRQQRITRRVRFGEN